MDIENSEFNPVQAFHELIQKHNLEELLILENNLLTEIKSLDTNMQTLVYENYNKFIAATDTIRLMKTNVESMEAEMSSLEESLSKISGLSAHLDEKLGPKQAEVNELAKIHEEMEKIKFIGDLPSLLRGCIEQNKNKYEVDFHEAAHSFEKSVDFLMEHKQDTQYASIYEETMDCVETIKKVLWNKLQDSSLPVHIFNKYTKELTAFKFESEKLPSLFCAEEGLFSHKKKVNEALEKNFEKARVSIEKPELVPEVSEEVSIDTIEQDVRLSISEEDKVDFELEGGFNWYIHKLHTEVSPMVLSAVSLFLKSFGSSPKLVEFSKDLLISYIKKIKEKLKELKCDISSITVSLHVINADKHAFQEVMPKEISVQDRFSELLEFVIRSQIQEVIEDLKQSVLVYIQNLYTGIQESTEPLPSKIEEPVDEFGYSIMYSAVAAIVELEPIVETSRSYCSSESMFVSLIVSSFIEFFEFVELILTVNSMKYPVAPDKRLEEIHSTPCSGASLIGALKLTMALEAEGIPKLCSTILDSYGPISNKSELNDIVNRVAEPEMLGIIKETENLVLVNYIEKYAKHFSDLIEEYTGTDWLYESEPIDISDIITKLVNDIRLCRKELKIFFEGEKPPERAKIRREKHLVEINMERLFARKAKPFEGLRFELNSILASIVKLTLKGLYEEIRLIKIGSGGYEQLEVDSEFLGSCLEEIVVLSDNTLLTGYISEIEFSASLRTTNPKRLERPLIEAIIENKKESLAG